MVLVLVTGRDIELRWLCAEFWRLLGVPNLVTGDQSTVSPFSYFLFLVEFWFSRKGRGMSG